MKCFDEMTDRTNSNDNKQITLSSHDQTHCWDALRWWAWCSDHSLFADKKHNKPSRFDEVWLTLDTWAPCKFHCTGCRAHRYSQWTLSESESIKYLNVFRMWNNTCQSMILGQCDNCIVLINVWSRPYWSRSNNGNGKLYDEKSLKHRARPTLKLKRVIAE